MSHLSCCRTNRKRSSFATMHFQRKSLKTFDLHPPLRRWVSFVARIITWKVRCWVTGTLFLLTLGAHAQRGLQYLVCVCVCVSVTQHLTFHVIIRATNDTNLLIGWWMSKILSDFLWKCFVAKLERFLLVRLYKSAIFYSAENAHAYESGPRG